MRNKKKNGNCNIIKDGVKIFTNFADINEDKINDHTSWFEGNW